MKFLSYFLVYLIFISSGLIAKSPFDSTKDLPVAHQGRFRSLDAAARLWLHDIYHRQELKQKDLTSFRASDPSALELLWKMHFLEHFPWDHSPLFWIHYADVKSILGFDKGKNRFSFDELSYSLFEDKETNLNVMKCLLTYEFAKHHEPLDSDSHAKVELSTLSPGLWLSLQEDHLHVASTSKSPPWNFLYPGFIITKNASNDLEKLTKRDKQSAEEILSLLTSMNGYAKNTTYSSIEAEVESTLRQLEKNGMSSSDIAKTLERQFPLIERLKQAGTTLKMLPARFSSSEWLSLKALKVKVYDPQQQRLVLSENFTSFDDETFQLLRNSYFALEASIKYFYSNGNKQVDVQELEQQIRQFAEIIKEGYKNLAGLSYIKSGDKKLTYPSFWRLKAETLYHRLPLIKIAIGLYIIALSLFFASNTLQISSLNRWGLTALTAGFAIHTAILILRCYVLQRPPVSNMFETVVYVPWIALLIGFFFHFISSSRLVIAASCLASVSLLIILELTQTDSRLENVQAVLDSQYWLIVHVLMVVGSYGAFAVSGILGHFYLLHFINKGMKSSEFIAKAILHTLYIGVALLIPGTILGGVWAAESWGRFWDWDPKESWAFISACIYVVVIHAYTFQRIGDFGLAIGAIFGLMAISFTWYGVNYILGTGMHSYGFGRGGENYYFLYLLSESAFLATLACWRLAAFLQAKKALKRIRQ